MKHVELHGPEVVGSLLADVAGVPSVLPVSTSKAGGPRVCERLDVRRGVGHGCLSTGGGEGHVWAVTRGEHRVTGHTGPVVVQRGEALLDGGGARRGRVREERVVVVVPVSWLLGRCVV